MLSLTMLYQTQTIADSELFQALISGSELDNESGSTVLRLNIVSRMMWVEVVPLNIFVVKNKREPETRQGIDTHLI